MNSIKNDKGIGDKKITRIVSLVPSMTEILFSLGLGERIVGVTEHCNFPEDAKSIKKIGTFSTPNKKTIISLKPDLILAGSLIHKNLIEALSGSKFEILTYNPESVEDIFAIMIEIGEICSVKKTANDLVESLRKRVARLSREVKDKKPKVMHIMTDDPIITPGTKTFQYDALSLLGVELRKFSTDKNYSKINLVDIKKFNPDIILFCGIKKNNLEKPACKDCSMKKPICQRTQEDIFSEEWSDITAVKNNRLIPLSCETLCRPGVRLVDGMEKLNRLIFIEE